MAIKLLSVLVLSLLTHQSFACQLKADNQYISLSGPITMLLEELGLLNDKSLLSISTLHPVKEHTSAKRLSGGIFLAARTLKSFSGKIVFIDTAKELEENIRKANVAKLNVVSTRFEDALQATRENIQQLKPYLNHCDQKINTLLAYLKQVEKKLTLNEFEKVTLLFYLGAFKGGKSPNLLILNDGAILTLIEHGMNSYPSELAYVSWSEKILKSLDGRILHFGMEESDSDELKVLSVTDNKYNLSMRGVLTPGIRQVKFLDKFWNKRSLFSKK